MQPSHPHQNSTASGGYNQGNPAMQQNSAMGSYYSGQPNAIQQNQQMSRTMYTGGMPGNGMVPATGEQPAQQQMVYATSSQYMPTVQQPCPSGAPAMNTSMPSNVSTAQSASTAPASNTSATMSSTQQPAPASSTHTTPPKPELKKALNPPPYEPTLLQDLDKLSVPTLASLGKEMVNELSIRTTSLSAALKAISDVNTKRGSTADPDLLLEYCSRVLDNIVEIRLRIEKLYPNGRMTLDHYLEMASNPEPPPCDAPMELLEKRKRFDVNKNKMIELAHDLKMLDYLCSVSDPSTLKRVDKLITKD